jgi:hypothetical protein
MNMRMSTSTRPAPRDRQVAHSERGTVVAFVIAMATLVSSLVLINMPSVRATPPCDALCTRVRSQLQTFTDWLSTHDAEGYIGEVGWPDDERWHSVAQRWYADADAASLPVTSWATGEWWPSDYVLAAYVDDDDDAGVDRANGQSTVIEAHPSTTSYRRGINVAGAEFGAPAIERTSAFSNEDRGAYGTAYHYESAETFRFLASRGVRTVRIPFRWERIQPRLRHRLDQAEVRRLTNAIDRASNAGLEVIVDMHNYAGYYLHDGSKGIRRALGSNKVGKAEFVDVWRRLSMHLRGRPGVHAYGLMNEPIGIAPKAGLSPAQRWEILSHAVVKTIRSNGDPTTIVVAGYDWSGVAPWPEHHPRPWIPSTLTDVRYEAHHYWDADRSGRYALSYDEEVAAAERAGYGSS